MLENNHIQTTLSVVNEQVNDEEIELTLELKVKLRKPTQTPLLPSDVEGAVRASGTEYQKGLCQVLIEQADSELVAEQEKEKRLIRYGNNNPYQFKTEFGTVSVKRNRVKYQNGQTEIVSARIWQTPQIFSGPSRIIVKRCKASIIPPSRPVLSNYRSSNTK